MTASSSSGPETGVPVCYRHPGRESHIRCQRCSRPICPDCMRDAAVGFQCPSCVAEGTKATRSGRTPYGGLRPTDASRTSMVLIGINAVVWLLVLVAQQSDRGLLDLLLLRPNGLCDTPGPGGLDVARSACDTAGGVYLPGVADGAYWQLLTSMFTHQAIFHIGFNMYALYLFGPQLELALGRARFLALYFLSGLVGSAVVYCFSYEYGGTLGASGAIFGLLGAMLVIAHKVGGDVRGLLTLIGINAVITFLPGLNISWQGHLGGFVGGVAIGAVLVYAPKKNRTLVQVAGMSAVGFAIVAAVVVRTAMLA